MTRAVKSPPSGPAPVILICGKSFLVPSGTTSEEAKVNPEAPEIMVFPIDVLIVPLFVVYIWSALFVVLFAPILPSGALEVWNSSFEWWVAFVLKVAEGISHQGLLEFFSQAYLQ